MSWCGGGEIRPTPGMECRTAAIWRSTFSPGNCPPSPGLAPCAILICRSSALTRYSAVTPKRPEATCLIAERMESPLGSVLQLRHAFRRPGVILAAQAEGIVAARIEHVAVDRIVAVGVAMPAHGLLG